MPQRAAQVLPHNDPRIAEIRRILKPTDEEMALLFRTSVRTLHRWLEDGAPDGEERVEKVGELLDLAKESLREAAIGEWFHEANRSLGGFTPIRMCLDPRGMEMVRDELFKAAQGLPV